MHTDSRPLDNKVQNKMKMYNFNSRNSYSKHFGQNYFPTSNFLAEKHFEKDYDNAH